MNDILKKSSIGLKSAVEGLKTVRRKFCKLHTKLDNLKFELDSSIRIETEAKEKLNENYILIAKLSSENLRLLGTFMIFFKINFLFCYVKN